MLSKGSLSQANTVTKGLFYRFGPAKSSGGFSVYFPRLCRVATEHVLSISSPSSECFYYWGICTNILWRISARLVVLSEESQFDRMNRFNWMGQPSKVSRLLISVFLVLLWLSSKSGIQRLTEKEETHPTLQLPTLSAWGLSGDKLKARTLFILSALACSTIIKAGSEQKTSLFFFLPSLLISFLKRWSSEPSQLVAMGVTVSTKRGLWFQVRKQQWAQASSKIQFCSEEQHCREALEDSPCFICLIYALASDPQQQNGILELKKSHINK